jgi:hypothetical protein
MMTESPDWIKKHSAGLKHFQDLDLGTGFHEYHIATATLSKLLGLPQHFIIVKEGERKSGNVQLDTMDGFVLAISSNYPPGFRELGIALELAYLQGGLTASGKKVTRKEVLVRALEIAKHKPGIDYLDLISFWECHFRETAAAIEKSDPLQYQELEACRGHLTLLHDGLNKQMSSLCTT